MTDPAIREPVATEAEVHAVVKEGNPAPWEETGGRTLPPSRPLVGG